MGLIAASLEGTIWKVSPLVTPTAPLAPGCDRACLFRPPSVLLLSGRRKSLIYMEFYHIRPPPLQWWTDWWTAQVIDLQGFFAPRPPRPPHAPCAPVRAGGRVGRRVGAGAGAHAHTTHKRGRAGRMVEK